MSTPEQLEDPCHQARENERNRCVEIIEQHIDGQPPIVQSLLIRLINLINNPSDEPDS